MCVSECVCVPWVELGGGEPHVVGVARAPELRKLAPMLQRNQ